MLTRIGLLTFAVWTAAVAQTRLTISPPVLTNCSGQSLASAYLGWRSEQGPVQVRLGSATGPPMSGLEPAAGGAHTGPWVADGMVFVLIDGTGREIARAVAKVQCRALSTSQIAQLATQSYFPLEVGNRWIYRYTDRRVTNGYSTRWIDRTVQHLGETWSVMSEKLPWLDRVLETLYRADATGRVHQAFQSSPIVQVYFDPNQRGPSSGNPPPVAWVSAGTFGVSTDVGWLPDAIYVNAGGGVDMDGRILARGVGTVFERRVNFSATQFRGQVSRAELVEASFMGRLPFRIASEGVELAPEFSAVDLIGGEARNCSVPCTLAGCDTTFADPQPVYKPCMFTRLKVDSPAASSVTLELISPTNELIYTANRLVPHGLMSQPWYETIPLYSAPEAILAPGVYQVRAILKSERGDTLGLSSSSLRVE